MKKLLLNDKFILWVITVNILAIIIQEFEGMPAWLSYFAPDFSDDVITDCSENFALNMSLLKASSLIAILDGFKRSKHQKFPVDLLMKDVLIQEERILKAIIL